MHEGLFKQAEGDYADGSDELANKSKYYIDFFHVPTGETVQFKAFLTNFNDSYTTEWNSEDVYGRMDPIQSYKGTKRKISLEWEVVAGSVGEAENNLEKCTSLFGMLYPVFTSTSKYSDRQGSRIVSNPPLMRVRFVNLIVDTSTGGSPGGSARETGLTCTINGFNYSPDINAGFMHTRAGEVYPQLVKLSCELTVMHTHPLGYNETRRRNQENFPYGQERPIEDIFKDEATSPPAPSKEVQEGTAIQMLDPRFTGGSGNVIT
jgi:hypothetical protein